MQSGTYTLKDMTSGEQKTLNEQELISLLQES